MARGLGIEPRSRESKSRVLPLNEPPKGFGWKGRKDSNLRCPGSEPGAVAAGPRPHRSFRGSPLRCRRSEGSIPLPRDPRVFGGVRSGYRSRSGAPFRRRRSDSSDLDGFRVPGNLAVRTGSPNPPAQTASPRCAWCARGLDCRWWGSWERLREKWQVIYQGDELGWDGWNILSRSFE